MALMLLRVNSIFGTLILYAESLALELDVASFKENLKPSLDLTFSILNFLVLVSGTIRHTLNLNLDLVRCGDYYQITTFILSRLWKHGNSNGTLEEI